MNRAQLTEFFKNAHPSNSEAATRPCESHDLFSEGWLDSLLALELLNAIENTTGKKVPAWQVHRKNLSSFGAIETLVERLG